MAVQAALETYRLDVQSFPCDEQEDVEADMREDGHIPLVVNTMGWTKGLGADLTSKIHDMVFASAAASSVMPVGMQGRRDSGVEVYEFEASVDPAWPAPPPLNPPHAPYITHRLQPIPPSVLTRSHSAADHRALAHLSYFHACFPSPPPSPSPCLDQVTATSWRTALPLCAIPPYEVDPGRVFEHVVLIGAGAEDVVASEVRGVLNGAVVGVVRCEAGTLDTDGGPNGEDADAAGHEPRTRNSGGIPYTQGCPSPSPATSTCVGLALIRSVSLSSPSTRAQTQMHVLTPLPLSLFTCPMSAQGLVLVKGEMELPIWGWLDFRTLDGKGERDEVPYLQWGRGEGIGGEKRRVRRNLMRRGQM